MAAEGHILVIDDNVGVCEAIASALRFKYRVRVALTGSEAMDALCEESFDLIMLDQYLPDAQGTSLLKLLKRFFPSTAVVLITGQSSEEVAIAALRAGARDYIRKPLDLPDLIARTELLFETLRHGSARRRDVYQDLLDGSATASPPDQEPDRARSILRAVRHIEAHLSEPITLTEAAEVAGMSKFHFCRRFKTVMGLSFRRFLIRARVGRAKELLRDGAPSITRVARDAGFQDLTAFARAFRRLEHCLPSEFRRAADDAEPRRPALRTDMLRKTQQ